MVHTLPIGGLLPDPVGRKSSVPWLSLPSPSDLAKQQVWGECEGERRSIVRTHKVGSSTKPSSLTRSDNPQSHPPAKITITNANVEVSSATDRRRKSISDERRHMRCVRWHRIIAQNAWSHAPSHGGGLKAAPSKTVSTEELVFGTVIRAESSDSKAVRPRADSNAERIGFSLLTPSHSDHRPGVARTHRSCLTANHPFKRARNSIRSNCCCCCSIYGEQCESRRAH